MRAGDSRHDPAQRAGRGIGGLAMALLREMAPTILFFFIALLIMSVLFKLFVAQYSITFAVFTRAAVGALILGKVVPLLDWAQSGHRYAAHRRIVVISGKTLLYTLAVILLAAGERLVEAYRKAGTVHGAVSMVEAEANLDHFLGLVLLIGLVVGAYLTLQAIDQALGKGTLLRILFARPQDRADDA